MTDEKKARAKRLAKKFINRKELRKTYDSCVCSLIEDVYIRAYKQALHDKKDGSAEGKPKWHDLRKDPNDLPKENGDYYVCLEDKIHTVQFWNNNHWCLSDKPIAWCELPKFEEE